MKTMYKLLVSALLLVLVVGCSKEEKGIDLVKKALEDQLNTPVEKEFYIKFNVDGVDRAIELDEEALEIGSRFREIKISEFNFKFTFDIDLSLYSEEISVKRYPDSTNTLNPGNLSFSYLQYTEDGSTGFPYAAKEGILDITYLDKEKKIVKGNFSFVAKLDPNVVIKADTIKNIRGSFSLKEGYVPN